MTLKVGDVVKLKTGGPCMTVSHIGPAALPNYVEHLPEGKVLATWFVLDPECGWIGPHMEFFAIEELVVTEPDASIAQAPEAAAA